MYRILNGLYYHNGVEITAEEYVTAVAELQEKLRWANAVYSGMSTLADVPAQWQDDVKSRVEDRQMVVPQDADDSTVEEILNIILGGDGK